MEAGEQRMTRTTSSEARSATDHACIEPLRERDIPHLLPLWHAYQLFYSIPDVQIDHRRNQAHIERVLGNEGLGMIFVARRKNDAIVGFATIYYSFSSTLACRTGIVNDLFVDPSVRGCGYGKRLLDHCIDHIRACGISIVDWATKPDNVRAQALYRRYSEHEEWYVYRLQLTDIPSL